MRGYQAGIEVARDRARLGFDGTSDVALSLARCPGGDNGPIVAGGTAFLGVAGALATSVGRGGSRVIAVGADAAAAFEATDSGLEPSTGELPAPPSVAPSVVIAFDADGDCDDDLFIGAEGAGALLWLRVGENFVEAANAFDGAPSSARAAAIADSDQDGDIDIVIGDATSLLLWVNDGAGRFSPSPGQLATDATSDITALAFVELDGDGVAELVVARGREAPAPVRLLAGRQGGGLIQVDAAAPEVALSVVDLAVSDLDGDRFGDILLAVAGGGVRVFSSRGDGRVDDRSFFYFPDGAPTDATAIAARDWDGDCTSDVIASIGESTATYRGSEAGFAIEGEGQVGRIVELADVDDDGDFDALLLDANGEVTWLKR